MNVLCPEIIECNSGLFFYLEYPMAQAYSGRRRELHQGLCSVKPLSSSNSSAKAPLLWDGIGNLEGSERTDSLWIDSCPLSLYKIARFEYNYGKAILLRFLVAGSVILGRILKRGGKDYGMRNRVWMDILVLGN